MTALEVLKPIAVAIRSFDPSSLSGCTYPRELRNSEDTARSKIDSVRGVCKHAASLSARAIET